MPRDDRFAIRAQAGMLNLEDTAQKSIPTLVRQFVFGRLNDSPTKFARLTGHDILTLAEAFVASHCTWLRENRLVQQDGNATQVSKTRETDLEIVSRIIQLQASNQRQRVGELKKANLARFSPDSREREDVYESSDDEYVAPEDRAAGKRKPHNDNTHARKRYRMRSPSPEHASGGTKSTSPQDSHCTVYMWSKDGAAETQGAKYHGGRDGLGSTRLRHTSENSVPREAEHDSVVNASSNARPRCPSDDAPPVQGSAVALERGFKITYGDAAVQTSSDLYEYVEDDAAVQTETFYVHTATQSLSPNVSSGWTQTPPVTCTDAATQTAVIEEDFVSVEINFYEAQFHLLSSRKQAEALAEQVSKATANPQKVQLKQAKDSVDFAVKLLTHLAEGRAVKVKVC
jgi:hypothetical protein